MRSLTAEQQSHKLSHGGSTPPASTGYVSFSIPRHMAGSWIEWLEWQKSTHDRVKVSYKHGSIFWLWEWFIITVEGPQLWVEAWTSATVDKLEG